MAEFLLAEHELQNVLDAKPDDEAALRQALKKVTDAGITGSISRVVQAVQEHLRQARMRVL